MDSFFYYLCPPPNDRFRDVAQPGSALAWGARGRKFESCRPDQQEARSESCGFCLFGSVGELALLRERTNKTVPTLSGRGFLRNAEGFKITAGNLGRPD